MALHYTPRKLHSIIEFGEEMAFAEDTTARGEIPLSNDSIALILFLELDISIATAAEPYSHGLAGIVDTIRMTIDGSDERINVSGYGGIMATELYTRRPAHNQIHGAAGDNQILSCAWKLPLQARADEGARLVLRVDFGDELQLDDTAANIVINSGDIKAAIEFGEIDDQTYLQEGSDTFGTRKHPIKVPMDGRWIEGISLFGDREVAADLYDVLNDYLVLRDANNILIELRIWTAAANAWYSSGHTLWSRQYLIAAYAAFHDDLVSRGVNIPTPSALITDNTKLYLDRTANNTIYQVFLTSLGERFAGPEETKIKTRF